MSSTLILPNTPASPIGAAGGYLSGNYPNPVVEKSIGLQRQVADLTALANLSTVGMLDGTMVYVNDVDDIYHLDLVASVITDAYDVIAGNGGGNWVSRMQGRWDDMQGDISQGAANRALTYDLFRDTPWRIYCMRSGQSDELDFRFQFSHSWRYDTLIYPHMHLLPLADPLSPQIIQFDAYYTWTESSGTPVATLSGWTHIRPTLTISPGDVNVQKYLSFGAIKPPSWARESVIFLLYIRRSGTDITDTYSTGKVGGTSSANLGLLSVDIHYRKNKIGSLTQIPT